MKWNDFIRKERKCKWCLKNEPEVLREKLSSWQTVCQAGEGMQWQAVYTGILLWAARKRGLSPSECHSPSWVVSWDVSPSGCWQIWIQIGCIHLLGLVGYILCVWVDLTAGQTCRFTCSSSRLGGSAKADSVSELASWTSGVRGQNCPQLQKVQWLWLSSHL